MTGLTRFVPFHTPLADMAMLQNRFNSIFNDFGRTETEQESLTMGSFIPPVDIYEDAQQLVLKLEVPGIKQENLDVSVENQMLTIKGERKMETDQKEENFHRIERSYGSFTRSFTLPQTVDSAAVKASYDAGVLTITMAKKEAAKPKQVKVEIGPPASGIKQVEAKAAA
ncbi:MAG: Hsp20/alpha crystallin family protein [Acidobacteriaceae bacterium]|nr:Hsp20/alpha crystallin family protein [Acidobacteriaceae bacterium]